MISDKHWEKLKKKFITRNLKRKGLALEKVTDFFLLLKTPTQSQLELEDDANT